MLCRSDANFRCSFTSFGFSVVPDKPIYPLRNLNTRYGCSQPRLHVINIIVPPSFEFFQPIVNISPDHKWQLVECHLSVNYSFSPLQPPTTTNILHIFVLLCRLNHVKICHNVNVIWLLKGQGKLAAIKWANLSYCLYRLIVCHYGSCFEEHGNCPF